MSVVGFKKLMTGNRAPRGIPNAFLCLLPILSCLLFFALGKGYHAKLPEERAELRKQWEGMSFGKKVVLGMRWGFSYKYPPMLGTPPPRLDSHKPDRQESVPMTAVATTTTQTEDSPLEPPPPPYQSSSNQ